MTDFLTHLAALSLGGALAVVLLMAAAHFTRSRYAARWRCLAWILLCLRLVIPVQLLPQQSQRQAPIQLNAPALEQPILSQGAAPSDQAQSAPESGGISSGQPPQSTDPSQDAAPPKETSAPSLLSSLSLSQIVLLLWLAGTTGVLIWALISHMHFLAYLRRWAVPVRDPDILCAYNSLGDRLHLHSRPRLLFCPGLSVPMLAGPLRPALLLPQNSSMGKELEYALLHELTHFRRRDIWLKALALAAAAVHWFNPFLWLMRRAVERDTELSCDEAALAALPAEEHAAYGQTILNAVTQLKAP